MPTSTENSITIGTDYTFPCGCVGTFTASASPANPLGVVADVHTPCTDCNDDDQSLAEEAIRHASERQ